MCLGIPGQVIEMLSHEHLARVDVAGVGRIINIGLLVEENEPVRPGDWVLIHVGFALSKIDEDEARATLDLLEQMGVEYEQELEELKASAID
jgi:hydrogenase expression/formation protein HypC